MGFRRHCIETHVRHSAGIRNKIWNSQLLLSLSQVQFQGVLFVLTVEYGRLLYTGWVGVGRAWLLAKFGGCRHCRQRTRECFDFTFVYSTKKTIIFIVFRSVGSSYWFVWRRVGNPEYQLSARVFSPIWTGGASAFASALMLGPRIGRYTEGIDPLPLGNPVNACMGLFVLWWGWLAFNSGSTYGVSGDKWQYAARAAVMTMMGCKYWQNSEHLKFESNNWILFHSIRWWMLQFSVSTINILIGNWNSLTAVYLVTPWHAMKDESILLIW